MKTILLLCALILGAVGCTSETARTLPEDQAIKDGFALVLADLGVFSEARVSRLVGKHYLPGDDAWQVIACYQFVTPVGQSGTECEDSFRLFQLDTGSWMVTVKRDNIYRWREILRQDSSQSDDMAAK